ncbi:ArsR/SmtB family transcription factor [Cellulomonas sp. Marseille-Q8402]
MTSGGVAASGAVLTDGTADDARDAVDDGLWSAVGDPTRRRLLDLLLIDGEGTATSLSGRLPVTRQAVAKHLGVLHRVGLVLATTEGREKRYRVDDAQLARAVAQLDGVGRTWDARMRRIQRIAEAIQAERDAHSPGAGEDAPSGGAAGVVDRTG